MFQHRGLEVEQVGPDHGRQKNHGNQRVGDRRDIMDKYQIRSIAMDLHILGGTCDCMGEREDLDPSQNPLYKWSNPDFRQMKRSLYP